MDNFWQKIRRPILVLAPMAGITDSAFRQICHENGADVVYSEMASVSALFYKPQKTLDLVRFNKKEGSYVVQLFGNNPEHFAMATKIISSKIKPNGIDINFGCPAKKVFGHGSGCALMKNFQLAREIISAVCENTNLPVSIKIRAGIDSVSAIDFIEAIKDLPFSAVMVHGRTYEQGFAGEADFEIVEKIKKIIPEHVVLGNGGINTPKLGAKILKEHPALDGLGIARGALGNPWIFEEIKKLFQYPSPLPEGRCPTLGTEGWEQIKQTAIHHAELIYTNKKAVGMFEIRKHLTWYFKGFPGASELRQKLVRVESVEEIKNILDQAGL